MLWLKYATFGKFIKTCEDVKLLARSSPVAFESDLCEGGAGSVRSLTLQ